MKPVREDEPRPNETDESHPAGDPRRGRSFDTAGMVTYGSAGAEESRHNGTTVRGAQLPPGDTLARPPTSGAESPFDPASGGGTRVGDDAVVTLPPVSTRPDVLGSAASVEEQLRRLESRFLAEAGGDPAVERDVRRHLAESCARFEAARVRLFVPILVEREVRRRLRDGERQA
jgi:hypothetical protein